MPIYQTFFFCIQKNAQRHFSLTNWTPLAEFLLSVSSTASLSVPIKNKVITLDPSLSSFLLSKVLWSPHSKSHCHYLSSGQRHLTSDLVTQLPSLSPANALSAQETEGSSSTFSCRKQFPGLPLPLEERHLACPSSVRCHLFLHFQCGPTVRTTGASPVSPLRFRSSHMLFSFTLPSSSPSSACHPSMPDFDSSFWSFLQYYFLRKAFFDPPILD